MSKFLMLFLDKLFYSKFLDRLFKNKFVNAILIFLIFCSILVALASLIVSHRFLEFANTWITWIFVVELSLRFFTYRTVGSGLIARKSEYLRDWWIDWVAIIPWELFLVLFFPSIPAGMARMLRLPRLVRLLRFNRVKSHSHYKYYNYNTYLRWFLYKYKRFMEGSLITLIFALLALSALIVWIFSSGLDWLGVNLEHGDNLWFAIITMISSDSLFELQGQGIATKLIVLFFTFIGVVLFNGVLIAIIVGKLMSNLEEIKKGYGEVCEKGHFILLGWNDCIPHILDELERYANLEARRIVKVVVLRDSVDNERDRMMFSHSHPHVEVILRVGNRCGADALKRILVREAAKIIVFGGSASKGMEIEAKSSDDLVTKTLASIQALFAQDDHEDEYYPDIILNFYDNNQIKIVKSYLEKKGVCKPGDYRNRIYFNPVFYTSKLIATMCSNPYAYNIYNELLTADGNEFHLSKVKVPKEICFADISCDKGIPVGFRANGEFNIVPSPDTVIPCQKVELVVLAENSSAATSKYLKHTTKNCANKKLLCTKGSNDSKRIVIIGVNSKLPFILEEMEKQFCQSEKNSESLSQRIIVVDNQPEAQFTNWYKRYKGENPIPDWLCFKECHFQNESEVEKTIDFNEINQIVLLADSHLLDGHAPVDQIDADTFAKLLIIDHLVNSEEHKRKHEVNIIVEILTPETEDIVSGFKNCSHVVGPLVISRFITTFTLYPELEKLFNTILPSGNVDIIIRPLQNESEERQLLPDQVRKTTFNDLLQNRPPNAIPLGWIMEKNPHARTNTKNQNSKTVVLNPDKNELIPNNAEIIYLYRNFCQK